MLLRTMNSPDMLGGLQEIIIRDNEIWMFVTLSAHASHKRC